MLLFLDKAITLYSSEKNLLNDYLRLEITPFTEHTILLTDDTSIADLLYRMLLA